METVYKFDDYKAYVKNALSEKGHGSRMKFAEALNCQSAYITQVLNKNAHLSMEQAADASVFFNMDQDEEDYFFLLVQFGKAGTKKLRDIYLKKIKLTREKRTIFSNRISDKEELDEATQGRYYSRWYYAAIHMIVTIPEYKTKKEISDYLGLRMDVLSEALNFLISSGLIVQTKKGYTTGKARVFLKGDSPLIVQHHQNWRMRAIDSFTNSQKENLHFSSVYTISKEDFIKIKEKLLTHIQEVREIVKPSKEEELCVFNVDFFKLNHSNEK